MTGARLTMADAIASAVVPMQPAERLLLFSLVRALQPERVLELGTDEGGAALIIVAALDDVGVGTLVCVDAAARVSAAAWSRVAHRATLRADMPAATDGPIDVIVVGGGHARADVATSLGALLPAMVHGAHLLFRDALADDVQRDIEACLQRYAGRLVDCGLLSVEAHPDPEGADGFRGGLRLLRYLRSGSASGRDETAAPTSDRLPEEALAEILGETTGLGGVDAMRAARGLLDPSAFPTDYVAECRALWKESQVDFVKGLYRLLLNRDADPSGLQYHVRRLRAGDSRLDVVRLLAFSDMARERGLPTDWIERLAALSPTFPGGFQLGGASWNRRLRSWVRRQPALARAARYVLVAGRTPWTVERLHALVTEQQQTLERQRRQIQSLERHPNSNPADAALPVSDRLTALAAQVRLQNRILTRLTETVERLTRDQQGR